MEMDSHVVFLYFWKDNLHFSITVVPNSVEYSRAIRTVTLGVRATDLPKGCMFEKELLSVDMYD